MPARPPGSPAGASPPAGGAPGGPPPSAPAPVAPASPPRPGRAARWPWIAGGVALALPLAALGAGALLLDGEALRARVEAAVSEATGRRFTLSGPVALKLSLAPTVVLPGPRLANAPGGSRPDMLAARAIEASVAILPLLSRRVEVRGVTVTGADLLLETAADGTPNWRLGPAPRPDAAPRAPAGAAPPARPFALDLRAADVADGRITWRGAGGATETLSIPQLLLRAGADDALTLRGQVAARGLPMALRARGGTLAALRAGDAPWPAELTLAAEGIEAAATGTLSGGRWTGQLRAAAESTARLAPLLPGTSLPPAEGLTADATIGEEGASGLRLGLARAVLADGLVLGPARVSAATLAEPATLRAAATLGALPLTLTGALPSPDALRAGGPWPVRASVTAEGAALGAEGTLAGPRLEGAALALTAAAADLAALGARAGRPLPALHDLSAEARLLGQPGGWAALEGLALRSREAEGGGTLRLRPGAVPAVEARLDLARLDLDALPPPPVLAPPGATPPAAVPPATPALPAPPPLPRPAGRRVIPDLPLPLAALRGLEGDATLRVAALRAGGLDWRDAEATLALHGGRLALDPAALTGPGGRVRLRLGADAAAEPPALSLRLAADEAGLDLAPLLAALGAPGGVAGRLEAEADLSGRGDDLRAVAASLSGVLALAIADGRIGNRLLDALAGDLRQVLLPRAPPDGSTALRCLALRLRAEDGVARAQAMLLETDLASVLGAGSVDLRTERLDLRLLPRARLGGLGLVLPVTLGGTLAAPQPRADPRGAGVAAAGILGELAARAGEAAAAEGSGDCAGQLRAARGGREGALPEAAAPPAATGRERAQDLLRGLLGR